MKPESNVTYEDIINRVRAKLGCGAERISNAPAPFRWSWWPYEPDIIAQLLSDHGLDTEFPDLEKEFYEEVRAIRETLDELGWEPISPRMRRNHPKRHSTIELPASFFAFQKEIDLHATALILWQEIAVPIRRRGEFVFRIWPPRDLMGSPIIQVLPLSTFLVNVVRQSAEDRREAYHLKDQLGKWKAGATILAFLVGVGILTWFL